MLPPRPPSPPAGPPRGTNLARRNAALPSPPLPAWISIFASSMNFMAAEMKKPCRLRQGFAREPGAWLGRLHAHRLAVESAVLGVDHLARLARIERVVAADADVVARAHHGAA